MSRFCCLLAFAALVPRGAAAQVPELPHRVDTAAVVAAAWHASAGGHAGLRPAVLAPSSFGPRVVAALRARGVVVRADTTAAGPDTVVYRVAGLEPQPGSAVRVVLGSVWEAHRGGCAYRSGNMEALLVTCRAGQCRAALDGPVTHGDNVCRPLQPGAAPR